MNENTCHYDEYSERYTECDGHTCQCPPESRWPRRCYCCGTDYDEASWSTLPHPHRGAVQHIGCGLGIDDGAGCLELRDCPCGSTLAIEIECHEEVAA